MKYLTENLFNNGIVIDMIHKRNDFTRHDIYRGALENFFKKNQTLSLEWVASQLGVRVCTIYNWIEGKGLPTILQQEHLFEICNYTEEGFLEIIQFKTKKGGSNV